MKQLGKRIVSSGPGYCVSFDGTDYQILLYNYCHYDLLYCNHDHSEIGITNRYDIYRDVFTQDIEMTLTGLEASKYLLKETFVNRSHGSAFDVWLEAGAPAVMSEALKEYIEQKAIPGYAETYVMSVRTMFSAVFWSRMNYA